jgi:hypothetical protein
MIPLLIAGPTYVSSVEVSALNKTTPDFETVLRSQLQKFDSLLFPCLGFIGER